MKLIMHKIMYLIKCNACNSNKRCLNVLNLYCKSLDFNYKIILICKNKKQLDIYTIGFSIILG